MDKKANINALIAALMGTAGGAYAGLKVMDKPIRSILQFGPIRKAFYSGLKSNPYGKAEVGLENLHTVGNRYNNAEKILKGTAATAGGLGAGTLGYSLGSKLDTDKQAHYNQGVIDKCAEYGVTPAMLIKHAKGMEAIPFSTLSAIFKKILGSKGTASAVKKPEINSIVSRRPDRLNRNWETISGLY